MAISRRRRAFAEDLPHKGLAHDQTCSHLARFRQTKGVPGEETHAKNLEIVGGDARGVDPMSPGYGGTWDTLHLDQVVPAAKPTLQGHSGDGRLGFQPTFELGETVSELGGALTPVLLSVHSGPEWERQADFRRQELVCRVGRALPHPCNLADAETYGGREDRDRHGDLQDDEDGPHPPKPYARPSVHPTVVGVELPAGGLEPWHDADHDSGEQSQPKGVGRGLGLQPVVDPEPDHVPAFQEHLEPLERQVCDHQPEPRAGH